MPSAGIITFHNAENYGAALQTYALKKTLENYGCDTRVIDYRNRGVYIRNMMKNAYYFVTGQNPLKNRRAFRSFQNNYLNLTEEIYRNVSDFEKDSTRFDFLFFGSDQIWNPDLSDGFDDIYFGQFRSFAKKIAYAASFGRDNITSDEQVIINRLLSQFDAVSVREETMLPLIDHEAECVLDPCMLLSAEEWNKIESQNIECENFILIYQLHVIRELLPFAKKLAQEKNLKIAIISPYPMLNIDHSIQKVGKISPRAFLAYFRQADMVLSDSFHGTIFSIIYEKPFYVFLPSEKTNRITSLLNKLNLSDRLFVENQASDHQIDYRDVNARLDAEINRSLAFIHRNLQ